MIPQDFIFRCNPTLPGPDAPFLVGSFWTGESCKALSIGPRSDVDQCEVQTSAGRHVVAVGAPLVIPMRSNATFYARPYSPGASALIPASVLVTGDAFATLQILAHRTSIPGTGARRPRAARSGVAVTKATVGAMPALFRMPFYGRKRALLAIEPALAGAALSYEVWGVVGQPNMTGLAATASVALDTGMVAAGAVGGVVIENEPYDWIYIHGDLPAASPDSTCGFRVVVED